MKEAKFGEFFRACRLRKEIPLRSFCRDNGFDAANISRLERGLIPPPTSREKLEEYAKALGLSEGSNEWYEFFDLAAAAGGRLPAYVMEDKELLSRLPIVFRTLRGEKISRKQLDILIEKIRKA